MYRYYFTTLYPTGAHGKVNYILVNDQIDAKTPFAIDRETGELNRKTKVKKLD